MPKAKSRVTRRSNPRKQKRRYPAWTPAVFGTARMDCRISPAAKQIIAEAQRIEAELAGEHGAVANLEGRKGKQALDRFYDRRQAAANDFAAFVEKVVAPIARKRLLTHTDLATLAIASCITRGAGSGFYLSTAIAKAAGVVLSYTNAQNCHLRGEWRVSLG
jgi:hypothetical protein